MKAKNTILNSLGFLGIIVASALISAILGGLFGVFIAIISPELLENMFSTTATSYAFAVGMIWGLFIGASAAAFACLLATLSQLFRRGSAGRDGGSLDD